MPKLWRTETVFDRKLKVDERDKEIWDLMSRWNTGCERDSTKVRETESEKEREKERKRERQRER